MDGIFFCQFLDEDTVWDTFEARKAVILNNLQHKCDSIIITRDGVVNAATHETLGKLPSVVLVHRYAASKTSIAAFNADDKESIIFAVLTSPNTWVTLATYEDVRRL